uniref:Uncharacterized protein n=1 Tax=Physcomitrium patens TaxID=3218 RepID=A0A2K1IIT5_PHYPA|nr:hypothetical protein PHYPA_027879 [Physcomitrium patens]
MELGLVTLRLKRGSDDPFVLHSSIHNPRGDGALAYRLHAHEPGRHVGIVSPRQLHPRGILFHTFFVPVSMDGLLSNRPQEVGTSELAGSLSHAVYV